MVKIKEFVIILLLITLILFIVGCKKDVKVTPIKEYTCVDDDGGLNYLTKGRTTISAEVKEDYCLDSQNLIEFYCEDEQIKSKTYSCSCQNGQCKN